MKNITHYIVMAVFAGQLAACQSTGENQPDVTKKGNGEVSERVDAAIEKAVITASKDSSSTANLFAFEKEYKRSSDNPEVALSYARALRQANLHDRAFMVLSPFADSDVSHPGIHTEMSMISLSLGNYDAAERYAQAAVLENPEDFQAYQNLGIALDAKEMHPEAERAFRKGLEHWKGNPTTIMNNLALNLATQGFVDEAVEVLERAHSISPDRVEIERNLRIIRTLNERE